MAIKFSTTFLLRKLHQLTGIVPLGVFFLVHMYTNSAALNGSTNFNKHVQDIHDLPYLLFVEILGIFLPLAFHSIYGVLISAEAKPNPLSYGYGRNWFYVLQRVTGIFLFVFLVFHILNFRFGLVPGLNMTPVAGHADQAFGIVAKEFAVPAIMVVYILGILATAWHLAYGIFLFAVDWGIVIGENAQKLLLRGCLGLALLLSMVGVNAAFAFVRPCGLLPQALCESPRLATPSGGAKF